LVPENSFGLIVKESPETVVIIDAVQLFLKPGAYRLLSAQEVLETGFSTHTLSPSVFMQYLKEATNADVYMLGIQPVNTELGSGVSTQLEESVNRIIPLIVQACGGA
jgi:hydrogenase maturation protease